MEPLCNDGKLLMENILLKRRIAELEDKIKLLEGKANRRESILNAICKIFTPGQIFGEDI